MSTSVKRICMYVCMYFCSGVEIVAHYSLTYLFFDVLCLCLIIIQRRSYVRIFTVFFHLMKLEIIFRRFGAVDWSFHLVKDCHVNLQRLLLDIGLTWSYLI